MEWKKLILFKEGVKNCAENLPKVKLEKGIALN